MKRLMMIAFHYPPCFGSSGLHRTLSFSRYLPAYGWEPAILTAHPRAYQQIGLNQLEDIPKVVPVVRSFALDTAKHLSVWGRYFKWMALPDRWVSWLLGAIPDGLRLIRTHKPNILWSTYPIATAHLIGLALHRLSGIPWLADFRDPMTEINPVTQQKTPSDKALWRARSWIESSTVKYCTRAVFTTPGAQQLYADRYPEASHTRWAIIPNGYDEQDFTAAEQLVTKPLLEKNYIVLLHSGILYPTPDRDPSAFFVALAKLQKANKVSASNLRVVLRASGYQDHYQRLIRRYGIEAIVTLESAIPYREALAEMLSADGLLIFQGYTSNPAIPAKLYEYFRARRPIFAMADAEGDTAKALTALQIGEVAPLDADDQIAQRLLKFLQQIRKGTASVPDPHIIHHYSRQVRSQEFAALLDTVAN